MKRYLLFAGDRYYPAGGWQDFKGSFDSLTEAILAAVNSFEWWHVVDGYSGKVVEEFVKA